MNPVRAEPCVCGGSIIAWSSELTHIREVVRLHALEVNHQEWRATRGLAVTDEELLGRVPLGDPTVDPDLVDLSGVLLDASGADAAPGKEAA